MINSADAPAATYMLSGITGTVDAQRTQYELPSGAEAFRLSANRQAKFVTSALRTNSRMARLQNSSYVVDCEAGGVIVTHP